MQRATDEPVRFACGALTLEGRAVLPPGAPRAAIICHPHPQYGGDMDNSVVTAATQALAERGFATLRFNFRGVGESEGSYAGGRGEIDDARGGGLASRAHTSGAAVPGRVLVRLHRGAARRPRFRGGGALVRDRA